MEKTSFQIVDISSDDIYDDKNKKNFLITLYGINRNNERIICHVKKYTPYFYIKVPDNWDQPTCVKLIKRDICDIKPNQDIENTIFEHVKGIQMNPYKDFYSLYWCHKSNNVKKFNFMKISFMNHENMRKLITKLKKHYNTSNDNLKKLCNSTQKRLEEWRNVDTISDCDSNMYESSIHPIIKFIHDTNIDPTGWIEVELNHKNDIKTGLFETCNYEYTCSFKDITPLKINDLSKYKIASFDIECDSSHGDFPMAKKNFKKLSTDIFDSYQNMLKSSSESRREIINESIFHNIRKLLISGFTGDISDFKSIYKYASMNKIFIKNNELPSDEIIDTIITNIEINDYNIINDLKNINIKGKDRDNCINVIQNVIEEECKNCSIVVEGDPIIQIGTVFQDFGTNEIYRHILVIGPKDNMDKKDICDDIPGIHVVKCSTEKELLLEWKNIIKKMDPDFITGYNIFGFDFKYIHDRAKILFQCPIINGKCKCNQWKHVKNCEYQEFMNFGKMNSTLYQSNQHKSKRCINKDQQLSSSALGDNSLNYITMDGRILFDIQKEIQKPGGVSLESYKLDNVAAHFMRGKIKEINDCKLKVSSTGHLKDGDYISFRTHNNIGEQLFNDGKKYCILKVDNDTLILKGKLQIDLNEFHKVEWCLNKDDISPQDIFDKHKQIENGSSARAEVAKYCIQDCELCINLLLLLDIIPNNLGMANVSYVPASYIFLRGQGVKVTSVVSKKSSSRKTRIPELKRSPNLREYFKIVKQSADKSNYEINQEIKLLLSTITDNKSILNLKDYFFSNKKTLKERYQIIGELNDLILDKDKEYLTKCYLIISMIKDAEWRKTNSWELDEWYQKIIHQYEDGIEGYEGAIVLEPKPGIYLDDPIAVLDYASLYPSSIIENNLSHETHIEDESLLEIIGEENYYTVTYQDWIYKSKGKGDTIEKKEAGTYSKCYFLKPEFMKSKGMFKDDENPMGIIPDVLNDLLSERKNTKNLIKDEKDEFKRKVLDGLQLAYKVTANSVYGQLGAKTSTIFKMVIAACTTSIGRSRIYDASDGVKKWAELKGYKDPDVIYGDTDSVFVKFSREVDDRILKGEEALKHCIQCGIEAGDFITKGNLIQDEDTIIKYKPILHKPQVLEYEKTFWPFILISKKRYTGDKYEFNTTDCKRTSMGIVLKRRDNAQIVKHVFGNVIEKIMIEKDFNSAVDWLKETLNQIRNEQFNLRFFVITKSLRGYYKNPQQIAHKVLADRMAARDPGNKPKSNDRIPYAYIKIDDKILYDYDNPYKSGSRKGQPRIRNIMQGDRIEHIDYIKSNNISLDYDFYISNQIMNPVKQVLDLGMDSKNTDKLFLKE